MIMRYINSHLHLQLPANPDPYGKWPLKWRERIMKFQYHFVLDLRARTEQMEQNDSVIS